ncbi:GNAT family N-acetyltransferase [Rhodohalobacter sp. SW132]|uniref:GNAT family N-acetyltransferase n=1 Tax=Rhodohalobacter sp. SW132 TaxID=2293433 RepID=UPI000E282C42|nr:GNAT family N-acetyltransferase [Rhodohalobacter sp. SW132]REL37724.1 GNAT family N-acetyltransferase [Rhodohalobacter sp. SW132]
MEAHLYLEARLQMVGSATDFTYKWCVNMGFDPPDAACMALAVDEILTDIVLYAFKEETGYIEVWFQYTFSEIEIIIQEKGEPFDPERYTYDAEKAVGENNFKGASLVTVRSMTDHFIFLNRGKDGKEFRLVKRFNSTDIRDRLPKHYPEKPEEDEFTPNGDYLLTPVTSEDAEDIAKLVYRSYGYSYSKEDLYFPRRIEMAILHEYKFGTIVRTPSGGPIGYFAVIKSTDSMIGEVGEAVVSPQYRKRGLMKSMLNTLIKMSRQRGLKGLFGEALTIHTYSQKVNQKFNFKTTALVVAKSPKRIFKGMNFQSTDNVGVVIDFLPLTRRWMKPFHLPEQYADLLNTIYDQFQAHLYIPSRKSRIADVHGKTKMELIIHHEKNSALIIVREIGSTFELSCKRMFRSIEELTLTMIYIDLPLGSDKINSSVDFLKKSGFVLAGLMPLFHEESDYLRMQKIMVIIDFDLMQTHSEIAGLIKERVKKEYDESRKEQAKA